MELDLPSAVYEVEVYLGYLRVRGTLTVVPARRLSDVLNETEQSFLTLGQAVIQPMHTERLEAAVRTDLVNVAKHQLEIMYVISEDTSIRDHAVQAGKVVRKVPHDVVIFLPNFLVCGQLNLLPEAVRRQALETIQADFIPITNASIVPANSKNSTVRQVPFVSVSKQHMLAMYFTSQNP
jgi:hypothetical protein